MELLSIGRWLDGCSLASWSILSISLSSDHTIVVLLKLLNTCSYTVDCYCLVLSVADVRAAFLHLLV